MLLKEVHVPMKKNNRKPKNRKSPPKKVKNAAVVDAASTSAEAPKKVAKPDGKPVKAVQKTAKAGKSSESGGASNLFKTIGLFLRQAKVELKKVKWPTRKELIASTVVVIVLTLLVSLYLGLVDLGLIKIIKHVIG
jgi:preprotein translocase subunit SecE